MFVRVAEVWRGDVLESVHHGIAAVATADGDIIAGIGDPDFVTFPRSALKPFQALPLLETGAADAFHLTDRHLALACASHRGEPFQVDLAGEWLGVIHCQEADLACGPDYPREPAAMERAIAGGAGRQRLYHNCSGKHCGFLTVSRHQGWPVSGYDRIDHPAQQLFMDAITELAGVPGTDMRTGIDGCNLPALAFSVADMARAVARFAAARAASPVRRAAIERLLAAMQRHPRHVSGTDQPTEIICHATGGKVLIKGGAEAYMAAWLPEQGLGIALKIVDGTSRARIPVLVELLRQLGLIDAAALRALADIETPAVHNSRDRVVGRISARIDGIDGPGPVDVGRVARVVRS